MSLAVDALACARLTRLLTKDAAAEPLRRAITKRAFAGASTRQPWTTAADLLDCAWCTSVWVACAVVAARLAAPRAWARCAQALAVSELAGLVRSASE